MTNDAEPAVRMLLATAGLEIPEDEVQAFVERYPRMRAALDALHAVPGAADLDPATVFSAVRA